MRKIVVKFGGSSLASAGQFQKAGEIIRADEARRYVVPSAPGRRFKEDTKVTDMLYETYALAEEGKNFKQSLDRIKKRYEEIIKGLGLQLTLDEQFKEIERQFCSRAGSEYAASRGEYLNGILMAEYLGFTFIDAAEVIRFDEDGSFLAEETQKVFSKRMETVEHAVIPGFYGADKTGTVHTFSRGGSDVTGSITAKAVGADLYENWTDVSGFLVADPRIIENPQVIELITYKELRELAYMGATVLHEDAIFPVRKEGIPINIRNTNVPEDAGTMIVADTCIDSRFTITGIAGTKGFASINIEKDMMNAEIGFGRKVLSVFHKYHISFDHMPSGIDTMTVFVKQEEFEKYEEVVMKELWEISEADAIEVEKNLGLIAVVGRGMKSNRGTAGRIFSALAHARINVKMIDQGASELNIIIGVENADFENSVKALYDIFVSVQL